MKKKELVAKVSARSKVSGIAVNRVIKSLVKTIAESVHAGEKVTLSGLGTLRMKTRKPKPARNLHVVGFCQTQGPGAFLIS